MRKTKLKDFLSEFLSKDELEIAPRGFEIIGDIAIVEISPELEKHEKLIGEAVMMTNRAMSVVLKKSGIHYGEFRTQDLKHIAGENRKETIYIESGIKLKINPQVVYFSARLSTERENLMQDLGEKRVLIMFSGAGPYTFVALKKQPNIKRITSIEINPQGHKYALESLELNKNLIKKSQKYKELIVFLKENELPIYEKKLVEIFNNLRLQFINGDVRVEVEKLKINKYEKEIKLFDNDVFKSGNKDIFENLINSKDKELFFDLDNLDKQKILPFIILFSEKFYFICKIENKNYIFDNWVTKNYLINYLENEYELEKINLFDEIFMPLPKDAELFLDSAFKMADNNCIIHMYDFVHESEYPQKSENCVLKAAKENGKKVEILQTRKVGQYSPGKYRVCCDFIIK